MTLHHLAIEVLDLYAAERFYRVALGFSLRGRGVSAAAPGLPTVLLERDGVRVALRSRPPPVRDPAGGGAAPGPRLSLGVADLDAEHARLAAVDLPGLALEGPRERGDGRRSLLLRDPDGNVVELEAGAAPGPRPPLQAVLFDLDGTLIDSEENYFLADEELLRRRGIVFTREDKRRYIGSSNVDQMRDLARRHGLSEDPVAMGREKNVLYLEIAERSTRLYPEMKRFWDLLRGRGIPVAVASGSGARVIARLLEVVGLAADVEVVVSAEEVARGKPAPDVFLEAARRLGVPAQACAVVEDSRPGVEAALRGSMRCIAVPYLVEKPLAADFALADLLFEDGMSSFDADRALAWFEAQRALG